MRTLLVGTIAGLVALVGFAGSASASATIDLLWNGTTTVTSGILSSSTLVLDVQLTAGALNINGYAFSLSYDPTAMSVVSTSQTSGAGNPNFGLQLGGAVVDDGVGGLSSFNGSSFPSLPGLGTGLGAGNTISVGTVTFHTLGVLGTFAVSSGTFVPIDEISDPAANDISGTSTKPSCRKFDR